MDESSIKYILPEFLRDVLKEPFGPIIPGGEIIEFLKNHDPIIAIGDYVSASVILEGIFPRIIIVDYITKRGEISDEFKEALQHPKYTPIKIINPPGYITHELWDIIEKLCKNLPSNHIRIEVEGEEDLAAIPAMLYAPTNATIIYGMPDKGVVVVPSTEEYKDKARKIIAKM